MRRFIIGDHQRQRRQRGQAMAEFAVAVGVLALLMLALPVLQRYHQLQMAAIGAARESAWLASWRGSPVRLEGASTLDARQLARRWLPEGESVATSQPPAAGDLQPQLGSLRVDLAGHSTPGVAGAAEQALLLPARPLQWLGSGFDLRPGQLIEARVLATAVTPDAAPDPFGGLSLPLEEHYSLLGDGWGASGPAQVARRAAGLVPASVIAQVPGLLAVGRALLSLLEPAFGQFCPGYIDPEIVPADRLQQGPVDAPATRWRPSC